MSVSFYCLIIPFRIIYFRPKNRMLVKIAPADRLLLQKFIDFPPFPARVSCRATNSLKTSSLLGWHMYLLSTSYRLKNNNKKGNIFRYV